MMDTRAAQAKHGIGQQIAMQGDVRIDALDDGLAQCDAHAGQRLLPTVAESDELAYHRIVVRRHGIAGIDVGIDPHARPARGQPMRDPAGAG